MVNHLKEKNILIKRRKRRIRAKLLGTHVCPRLTVFRSHKHIYAQLIDDVSRKTLVSASDLELKKKMKKSELAKEVGTLLAEKAKKHKITKAVFDRGSYQYHGRVKILAEAIREASLKI